MTTLTHFEEYGARSEFARHPKWRGVVEKLYGVDPNQVWTAFPMALGLVQGTPAAPTPEDASAVMVAIIKLLLDRQEDKYSVGALLYETPAIHALGAFLGRAMGLPPNEATTTVILAYHMLSHERAGKRVYDVDPGLADKLLHTELRGLLTDDLRLPYENVYVQVPEKLGLQVWNSLTGWHPLRGVYVTEDSRVGKDATDLSRGWRILLCGASKSGIVGDDALSHFWVKLTPGAKLDDELDKLEQDMTAAGAAAVNGDSFGEMRARWRGVFTWLMNVILYVTWSDPGEHFIANREARQLWGRIQKLPRGDKRSRLQSNFQKLQPQARIVLTPKTVVRRGGDLSEPEAGTESRVGNWVRTRVAGHWRNQPHGPQNSLRKLLWIQPFWRGAEDAPVSTPKHEVRL